MQQKNYQASLCLRYNLCVIMMQQLWRICALVFIEMLSIWSEMMPQHCSIPNSEHNFVKYSCIRITTTSESPVHQPVVLLDRCKPNIPLSSYCTAQNSYSNSTQSIAKIQKQSCGPITAPIPLIFQDKSTKQETAEKWNPPTHLAR